MRYIIAALLLISVPAAAQQWKSYIVSVHGDTLNCVDMQGRKQGPWVVKVETVRGERGYEEEGYFHNDKKDGVWRRFSLEGDLIAVENYRYGHKDGKNVYFNNTGELMREESWRAIDPNKPYDTVDLYDVNDPSKVIGKQVVKLENASYKHGTWKYYDGLRGTVEKTEEWVLDKLKSDPDDGFGDLAPIDVTDPSGRTAAKTGEKKPEAAKKPQAVLDFEKKNAGKKKVRVQDGSTGGNR